MRSHPTARSPELNNFLFRVSCGFEIRNELIHGLLNDIENSSPCFIRASPQSPHLLLIEAAERKTAVQEELHEIGGCFHGLTSKPKPCAHKTIFCVTRRRTIKSQPFPLGFLRELAF
jgi:hypothetical protein